MSINDELTTQQGPDHEDLINAIKEIVGAVKSTDPRDLRIEALERRVRELRGELTEVSEILLMRTDYFRCECCEHWYDGDEDYSRERDGWCRWCAEDRED